MSHPLPCRLTAKDHAFLEAMLKRCEDPAGAHAALLRRKLGGAGIWLSEDIPPNVVTLNSRVSFRAGEAPATTRIVAPSAVDGVVGMLLPVTSLRGLALLGLAEGESIALDAESITLTVVEVAYQPEAAHREAVRLRTPPARPARPALRLVHSAPEPATRFTVRVFGGNDDPGPSAA